MKRVFNKALERWGIRPYYLCAVEELSELTKAITKLGRRELFGVKPTKEQMTNFIDELADVEIMSGMVKHYHKVAAAVAARVKYKLKRMEARAKAKGRKYV